MVGYEFCTDLCVGLTLPDTSFCIPPRGWDLETSLLGNFKVNPTRKLGQNSFAHAILDDLTLGKAIGQLLTCGPNMVPEKRTFPVLIT